MNIKGFDILDYKLNIVYNKDMHYPLQAFVYDHNDKLVYTSYYVTTDELRYGVHQEMLIHLYDGGVVNNKAVEILLTVESIYKELNAWIDEIDYDDMTSLQEDWSCSKCVNKGDNSAKKEQYDIPSPPPPPPTTVVNDGKLIPSKPKYPNQPKIKR